MSTLNQMQVGGVVYDIEDSAAREAAIMLKQDIPTDDHINSLIDTKLGVIENGSY